MKIIDRLVVVLIVLLVSQVFSPVSTFGGTTGKIAGTVKDQETGDPLPGANVIIEGTNRGAATDPEGRFLIINVTPGTYNLKIQMMGYAPALVTDIRVFSDRTRTINVDLSMMVIEGQEVVVVAGREVIEFDRTNSASYVGQEEIEELPVQSLSQIIQLQAGVITDAGGGMHFRGGRSREVAYMIDGIPVSNSFSQGGGSNVNVENNMVKELQVITGTFNAEYGSAQSGIVNVVTKVPDQQFKFTLDAIAGGFYAPNKPQYIGLDTYDPLTQQELKFSVSGPLGFLNKLGVGKFGFFVNGRYVDDEGYLNGERRFMPEDGWEIEVFREWYWATYDPRDPAIIPVPDSLHTGDGSVVPINWSKSFNINSKLVYQPFPSLTASYNLFLNNGESKGYSHSWRFCPDALPFHYSDNITHMFVLTHSPVENIFYNLRFSHQANHSKSYTYEDPNDPRYQSASVNSWDPGKITGFDYGGIYSWGRGYQDRFVDLVNGDLTWQLNKIMEIKSGFEMKSHDINYKNAPLRQVEGYEIQQFPYTRNEIRGYELPYEFFRDETADFEYGTIRVRESSPDSLDDHFVYSQYNRTPLEASAYTQTKLNMGEIILNAGLRFDYIDPQDRWAPDYSIVFPEAVGADTFYVDAKSKYKLSPRFGLSFPISEKGAMRLSYGHFFQTPSFEKMYQNPVLKHYNHLSIADSRVGNPNLTAEKTIQYEFGLQQELSPGLSMEVTVFYKDIRDLLGLEILTLSNATTFYRYVNKEYGNSSGITVAFDYSPPTSLLAANIDYTYMIAKGTASSAEALRDVAILSGSGKGTYTLATRRIDLLGWDQTHSLNGSVSLRPRPDLYLSVIGQLGSGLPYTPATLDQNIEIPGGWWDNAGRKPLRWELDIRVFKSLKLMGMDVGLYFNVFNLFNHLNQNSVDPITGKAGPQAYLPEIARKRYWRLEQVGAFTVDEADYNPTQYSRPRLIQFGLSLGF